jgi:site-specific DNA-methyltransferase (adenine-specific)
MIEPYYIDSDCTLYNAKWEDVLPQLPEQSVDMVLCDLPYGVTSCEWDTKPDLEKLWGEYRRIAKPTAAIVLFGVQPFTTDLINSAREVFKQELIWDKLQAANAMLANKMVMRSHENILLFCVGQPIYNPQRVIALPQNMRDRVKNSFKGSNGVWGKQAARIGSNADEGERFPLSVLRYSSQGRELHKDVRLHPTQKPVDLCAWLIRTYTNEGDIVLDNTCGAGTTLVAAKLTGRRSIGVESGLKYCELAVRERLNRPMPLFDDERANYEQQQIFS